MCHTHFREQFNIKNVILSYELKLIEIPETERPAFNTS